MLVESCVAPVTVPANPSAAPEIVSVEIHNNPIIKPPTYTTNPYTGKEEIISSGGPYAPNGSIIITLKNQPFTAHTDQNGNYVNRYYSFFLGDSAVPLYAVYQSDSAFTVVTFTYGIADPSPTKLDFYAEGGRIVFRVQAVIGYFNPVITFGDVAVYEGEGSKMTEITLEIPSMHDKPGTSNPNINPTSVAPSASDQNTMPPLGDPKFRWLYNLIFIVMAVCVITIPLVIVAYHYGQRKNKHCPNNNPFNTQTKDTYEVKTV